MDTGFVLVATIHLNKSSPFYRNKFGFDVGGENQLWLRANNEAGADPSYAYIAEVRSTAAGTSRRFKATHHMHGLPVMTARWLRDEADEEIWTPCPSGCCRTTDDGF